MITKIVDAALGNRAVVMVLVAVLIGLGVMSMKSLPFDADPDISPLQVLVATQAPGLAPLDVERQVTKPIELALQGLPGMQSLRSVSRYGVSVLYVRFADGSNILTDREQVSQRLATVMLPPGSSTPQMGPLSDGLSEIYQFQVEGQGKSLMDLRTILNWQVAPRLKQVPGVVDVNVNGGELKTYSVQVSGAALTRYGLSVGDVETAIQNNDADVGGATIDRNGEEAVIRGQGLLQNQSDIGNIVLRTSAGGAPLYVRDVAKVVLAPMPRLGGVTRDGKGEAVIGVVLMGLGQNTRVVASRVTDAVAEINKTLPPGVKIAPYYNRADLIDRVLGTIGHNLVEGAILVIAVLFLLLGNLRAGLIVAAAIPLSMLAAAIAMYCAGLSGNLMSLGAIDFGLLVDGAVVMIENVVRRRAEFPHRPVQQVVREAAIEVARPVTFAVIIITAVYMPILSLQGLEGKMFRPMALTVIFALLASLVLSLTLMPVLASFLLKKKVAEHESKIVLGVRRIYGPALAKTQAHPAITIGAAVVLLAVAILVGVQSGIGIPAQAGRGIADRHHHQAAGHFPAFRVANAGDGRTHADALPRGEDRGDARRQLGNPHRPDGHRAERHLHHPEAAFAVEDRADPGRAGRRLFQGAGRGRARHHTGLGAADRDAHGRPAAGRAGRCRHHDPRQRPQHAARRG